VRTQNHHQKGSTVAVAVAFAAVLTFAAESGVEGKFARPMRFADGPAIDAHAAVLSPPSPHLIGAWWVVVDAGPVQH
jgi:hypothetical protein